MQSNNVIEIEKGSFNRILYQINLILQHAYASEENKELK